MERLNDLGVSHLSVLGLTVAAFHYYLNQSNISLMETLTEIIQGAIVALTLIITARYFSTLYNRHQAENKTLRPLVVGKKLKIPKTPLKIAANRASLQRAILQKSS
jgi:hypothetical protein